MQRQESDDSEHATQEGAAGSKGHRPGPLSGEQETMTGQGCESRVFGRCAEKDARDKVENRVTRRGCEQKAREEEACRGRIGGCFGDEESDEADPRILRRKEERRDVVHMEPGRKPREDARQDPEAHDEQESQEETCEAHLPRTRARPCESARCT